MDIAVLDAQHVDARYRHGTVPSRARDPRPRFDLNKGQVTHLIRAALLEDATNASERLGASLAEIWVDDDLGVVVSFEDHYWPEGKEPAAEIELTVAGDQLGIFVLRPLPTGGDRFMLRCRIP